MGDNVVNGTPPPEVKVDRPLPPVSVTTVEVPAHSGVVDAPKPRIQGYDIYEPLGSGGMGTVWRACQRGTRRDVALKLMNARATGLEEKDRARFEREVELAARLDHPNIARVYESGVDRGIYYYTMQLVEGDSLDRYVARGGLTQERVLQLMAAICQAVQHAHQRGVIHRDLKPSNIMITPDGQPFILDFGLAKAVLQPSHNATISIEGSFAGTVGYMSPEQAAGKTRAIDTRSDVYALGVILFHLLTDQFPHDMSGTPMEVCRRIVDSEILPPRQACKTLHKELETILLKALAKAPEDRYASAGELGRDIENYLAGEPLTARPPTIGYFLRKRLRKHRVPVGAAVAILLSVFLLVAVGYARELKLKDMAQQEAHRAKQELEAKRRALYFLHIALAEANAQSNIRRVQELLAQCPKDLRRWEWDYLRYFTDQAVATLRGHEAGVSAAVFLEGGHRVRSADFRTVKTWDVASQQVLVQRPQMGGDPRTLVLSPDGRWSASIVDQTIQVQDLNDARVGDKWPLGQGHGPHLLAFSHDASYLAAVGHHQALVWNRQAQSSAKVSIDGYDWVEAIALSGNADRLAVGGTTRRPNSADDTVPSPARRTGWVTVWDTRSGRALLSDRVPRSRVLSMALSEDGQRVAAGALHQTMVWDIASAEVLMTLPGAGDVVCFSPTGEYLATADRDGLITLWHLETGRRVAQLRGHHRRVASLRFNADGSRLISAGAGATVKIWDTGIGDDMALRDHVPLGRSADGRWMVFSDKASPYELRVVHTGAAGETRSQRVMTRGSHDQPPTAAAIHGDGERLVTMSGIDQKTLTLWSIHAGTAKARVTIRGQLRAPAFSGAGQMLAVLDGDRIRRFDARSGRELPPKVAHQGYARALIHRPRTGQWVTAGDDSVINVWDAIRGTLVRPIPWETDNRSIVTHIAVSPDGRYLLAQDMRGRARLWDFRAERWIKGSHPEEPIRSWAFSPDSQWLAVGGYGVIRIMDTDTGRVRATLRAHGEFVEALAFSPDGQRLISAGDDAVIKLWDPESGTEVLTLEEGTLGIRDLAFNADGQKIMVITRHGEFTQRLAPRSPVGIGRGHGD